MSVNIIFRIAAVGILVTILVQVLKHFDHTCRIDPCPWLGDPVYL